jgi:Asp-tRNA(Asn)/Glu-tRNA(Gln) amidotransferase A subunit family amidase
VVKQIKAAGGIIIAKTNVPQTMLSFECSNPLWGLTTNPWSKYHTCGGSSGGEAAALTCDASVIGIGSDIGRFNFFNFCSLCLNSLSGGSLRIPVHFCGIFSLKPTARRISAVGSKGKS